MTAKEMEGRNSSQPSYRRRSGADTIARERVGYKVAGAAIRQAFERAAEAQLSAREGRVLAAIVCLTASYSKLVDELYAAEIGTMARIKDDEKFTNTRIILRKLRDLRIIIWVPSKGHGKKSRVGLYGPRNSSARSPFHGTETVQNAQGNSSTRGDETVRPDPPYLEGNLEEFTYLGDEAQPSAFASTSQEENNADNGRISGEGDDGTLATVALHRRSVNGGRTVEPSSRRCINEGRERSQLPFDELERCECSACRAWGLRRRFDS